MTQRIRRLTSLNNLERLSNSRGQIATLLILVIVLMLIFVLVLANLGNVATNSTTIANAADSAALSLGSQLSTKARQLWESLGKRPEVCVKGGFLAMMLAILFAVVAVVVTILTYGGGHPLLLVAIGMIAGAAGGAIGGAVAGTGAAQGAMTGAMVGAAIGSLGSGIYAIAAAPATVPESAGAGAAATTGSAGATIGGTAIEANTAITVSAGQVVSAGSITIGATATTAATTVTALMSTTAAIGAIGLGTLSVASSVYNQTVAESQQVQNMKDMASEMNKLGEPARIRESVLLQALSQVVDDPHKSQNVDPHGSLGYDLSGDTSKFLSDFSIFYFKRLGNLTTAVSATVPLISNFLNNAVGPFADAAFNANGDNVVLNADGSIASVTKTAGPGDLEKADYASDLTNNGQAIPNPSSNPANSAPVDFSRDGAIVLLLRALYPSYQAHITNPDPPGNSVVAWQPGPTPDALNSYASAGCDDNGCGSPDEFGSITVAAAQPPAPGYDYVDSIGDGLLSMAEFAEALKTRSASELTIAWENWMPYFFDVDSYNSDGTLMAGATPDPAAYYEELGTDISLLTQLKNEIIDIRANRIPACGENWWNGNTCSPCVSGAGQFGVYPNPNPPPDYLWGWYPACGNCAANPPCRFSDGVGTIDQLKANDEFANAITAIDNQTAEMSNFRSAIMDLFIGVKAAQAAASAHCTPPGCCANSGCANQNCAEYCWTDSRGDEHVLVQLGAYKIPAIRVRKSGNFLMNKTCNYIWPEDWRSGGNMDENQCSVMIIRVDPTKSLGPLGYWNPFAARPVTKKAWAYYKWDRVGLK